MVSEYERLRVVVLEYLKGNPTGQLNLIQRNGGIFGLCDKHGLPATEQTASLIQQLFHELYLERLIITGAGPQSIGSSAMDWPFYRLTDHGKRVIESVEYIPYDSGGYLGRLSQEVANVDATVVRYLEEALGCFKSGYLLASSVMLGCAAEKVLLQLVEAFGNALADPVKKADYEKDTKSWVISRKYDALWKRLEPLIGKLPPSLGDDLHVLLDRVFDLIRTTRNDAGHPTGKKIEREVVHANLILFPSYCRRVYGLMGHFAANPVT